MIVRKKKLGMGLDLLLTAVEGEKAHADAPPDYSRVAEQFDQAIQKEEAGEVFEAYYLYRQVMDALEYYGAASPPRLRELASQACNNIAIILFESGRVQTARSYLEKALEIDPDNATARWNLEEL